MITTNGTYLWSFVIQILRNDYIYLYSQSSPLGLVCLIVFNATFNNISVISWRSVWLVEETGGPGENHRTVVSHWQKLSHNVVHLARIEIRTHNINGGPITMRSRPRRPLTIRDKMTNREYHIVGTILKSNIKLAERCKIDTPNTQIHYLSLSGIGTGTSVKSGGVKLVLWPKHPLLWCDDANALDDCS